MTDLAQEPATRRIWAVVPFRGPVGSKRRLAGLLDPSERERLSLAMLADVLDVLLASGRIEGVLLMTPSRGDVTAPEHARLTIVEEPREADGTAALSGLNAALRHAQQLAERGGAESLLIVPADLPLMLPSDLHAVLDAAASADLVIAPDRAAEGTNALLLTPPALVGPCFGERSYARHRRLADEAGLRVAVLERPRLALDLDTPTDVAVLLAARHDGRAVRLLRELQVERRLEPPEPAQARSTTI
jgi:2-phospho-L-lactate guanylyltransferase